MCALKGSYNELYACDVATGEWSTRVGLPLIGNAGRKKKVKDGAGIADHDGRVYALKGGNTDEAWGFETGSNCWTLLIDIQPGSGRNRKGGGALVATENALALKGNNTLEFHKYGLSTVGQASSLSTGSSVLSSGRPAGCLSCLRAAPNPWCRIELPLATSYSLPRAGNVSLLSVLTGLRIRTTLPGMSKGKRYSGPFAASNKRRFRAIDGLPLLGRGL